MWPGAELAGAAAEVFAKTKVKSRKAEGQMEKRKAVLGGCTEDN